MAEYAEALIRRTKQLSVSGICALAVGAAMLGGGAGIAHADQIGADPSTVSAGPSNVESETHGISRGAASQGDVRASEAGNCSIGLSEQSCGAVTVSLPSVGGEARQSAMAVPVVTGDSPSPGNLSACLYNLSAQAAGDAWNWAGHPGC